MGPALPVVVVPIVCPARVSVNVLELPLWPSTHMTAQGTPLTVAPLDGWVIDTRSVLPPLVLLTVTEMRAEAVRPPASVTVADSVCAPLPTAAVFQENVALLESGPPSDTWSAGRPDRRP